MKWLVNNYKRQFVGFVDARTKDEAEKKVKEIKLGLKVFGRGVRG